MSLVIPYEKMWDMPLGGVSDERQIPHWFGNIAYGVGITIFKALFRYHVDGRENLRAFSKKSGIVVVAPHKSYLDVVFMYLVTRPSQWVRFMGHDKLFPHAKGLLGQMLSRFGAFPIKRDYADRTAIKRAVHMLKTKEVVGLFPEGTRRGRGDREPTLHSGAALIARMGDAPILPMCARDTERVKQKGHFMRFPKITVEYGAPILVSDFDFLPKDERLDACIWYSMRQCFALDRRVSPDEIDMRELFPNAHDFTDVFREHTLVVHTPEEICAGISDESVPHVVDKSEESS